MIIKDKPTVDKTLVGKCQAHLDKCREVAAAEVKELKQKREAFGAKKGEGRVGGWHRDAVLNAIMTEGPEVMTAAGDGYWKDMKRKYPEMCADDNIPGTDSPNGLNNRLGRVSERMIKGQWYHWDAALRDWVPGEITKRKGIF